MKYRSLIKMSIKNTYRSRRFEVSSPVSEAREETLIPLLFQEKAKELSEAAVNYIPAVLDISPEAKQCKVTWNLHSAVPLSAYRKAISPDQCLYIVKQAVFALFRLHEMDILHGNICPDTVRITSSGNLLLAGINFQDRCTGNECTDLESQYRAPDYIYTRASDVYSLGKVFLYMLNGKAHSNIHKTEFHSMALYRLIRDMTEQDSEKRLQLKSLSREFLGRECGRLVETAAVPSPDLEEIGDVVRMLLEEDSSIPEKLQSDYNFMHTNNLLSKLYGEMVRLLDSLSAKDAVTYKSAEVDQTEARQAGSSSLKSALLYQKTKLYSYAKYCYCRALLAYHLAGDLESEGEKGLRHYWEVRSGKAVCYANLMELVGRTY